MAALIVGRLDGPGRRAYIDTAIHRRGLHRGADAVDSSPPFTVETSTETLRGNLSR